MLLADFTRSQALSTSHGWAFHIVVGRDMRAGGGSHQAALLTVSMVKSIGGQVVGQEAGKAPESSR